MFIFLQEPARAPSNSLFRRALPSQPELVPAAHGNAVLLQRWLEGTVPRFHEVTDWLEHVVAELPKTAQTEGQPVEEMAERPSVEAGPMKVAVHG